MRLIKIKNFDDLVLVGMELLLASCAIAFLGPMTLAFVFVLVPRGQEAAEEHDLETEFLFGAIVGFCIFTLLWWLLGITLINHFVSGEVVESTGC